MATKEEVYDSIICAIQKQIDIIDNLEIKLTDEQIQKILIRIQKYNEQLEMYSKRMI